MLLLPPVLDPVYGTDYAVDETRNRKVHVIPTIPASAFVQSGAKCVSVLPDRSDILPPAGEGVHDEPQYVAGPTGYEYYDGDLDRPRVPLIVLAQQGQHEVYYPEEYPDEVDSDDIPLGVMSRGSRLSTITEITERTEPSRHWPSKQQLVALNNPRASMITDTTTSYGEVIDTRERSTVAVEYPETAMDPNFIPPSPSPSAVRRLSNYEAAPSLATSVSQSDVRTELLPLPTERATSRAKSSVIPVPPMDTLPEISDFQSKASEKPLPPKPPASIKPSKLSMLASSRASTRSSRSSDLETTSVLTYPALRPTAESRLSFATTIKPPPAEKMLPSIKAPSTTPSSMSGHVKQAIQTALELEAHDRERAVRPAPMSESSVAPKASSVSIVKPTVPHSPPRADATPNLPIVRQEVETKARPQSKLAALAQAKASANTSLMPKLPKSPPSSPPKELPKPHTQYFTPIANGATATTAITTSYQSLQSLSRPQAQGPASLVQMPAEPKQSKLAMKVKKASEKPQSTPPDDDTVSRVIIPSPLFIPKPTNPRASPSAFASLLLDDPLTPSSPEDNDTHSARKYGREVPHLVKVYEASHSQSNSSLGLSQSQRHKSSRPRVAPPGMKMHLGFAFDVPSPDDIVFNARRGTSLAHRR
ncbi:uncharacterized protein BJ212DRAFT_1036979 [Suillus subaureus]|uniref:Uncharacterized protein n=1 Tax=Suillus subaureus TaxID=48587 RepID=A0A9P7EH73_9AGAM|nr:uncharacterized protein BJ212DRAFT_1036979 [Suillus subaureus]KAG1820544.1 hypothetical protein BJ212DRAFT_1036979 [Suillus subaureus]